MQSWKSCFSAKIRRPINFAYLRLLFSWRKKGLTTKKLQRGLVPVSATKRGICFIVIYADFVNTLLLKGLRFFYFCTETHCFLPPVWSLCQIVPAEVGYDANRVQSTSLKVFLHDFFSFSFFFSHQSHGVSCYSKSVHSGGGAKRTIA